MQRPYGKSTELPQTLSKEGQGEFDFYSLYKGQGMRAYKGQSTVEYILLVTAVIMVVILFTTMQGPGGFQGRLTQVFSQTSQDMVNTATYLQVNAANGS